MIGIPDNIDELSRGELISLIYSIYDEYGKLFEYCCSLPISIDEILGREYDDDE